MCVSGVHVCACLRTFVVCMYMCGSYMCVMDVCLPVLMCQCAHACCACVCTCVPCACLCAFFAYCVCRHVVCVPACTHSFERAASVGVCFHVFSVLVYVCVECVCLHLCVLCACVCMCLPAASLRKLVVMLECGRECKSPFVPWGTSTEARGTWAPHFEYIMRDMIWFVSSRSWRPRS